MRMEASDVMGSMYVSWLRMGGYSTEAFNAQTADLERNRPGIRGEILAEAFYVALWLHRFPEVVFLLVLLTFNSIPIAFAGCAAGYVLEIARLRIFGSSELIAWASRLWSWCRVPLFIGVALTAAGGLPAVLIAFLILQGFLKVGTSLILLPVRLALAPKIMGEQPGAANLEASAVQLAIQRWRRDQWTQSSSVRKVPLDPERLGTSGDAYGIDGKTEDRAGGRIVIACTSCGARLRVPRLSKPLIVTCSYCASRFRFDP